jgi:hypothetical protein
LGKRWAAGGLISGTPYFIFPSISRPIQASGHAQKLVKTVRAQAIRLYVQRNSCWIDILCTKLPSQTLNPKLLTIDGVYTRRTLVCTWFWLTPIHVRLHVTPGSTEQRQPRGRCCTQFCKVHRQQQHCDEAFNIPWSCIHKYRCNFKM